MCVCVSKLLEARSCTSPNPEVSNEQAYNDQIAKQVTLELSKIIQDRTTNTNSTTNRIPLTQLISVSGNVSWDRLSLSPHPSVETSESETSTTSELKNQPTNHAC